MIIIRGRIAERVRKEARKLSTSVDEYIIEAIIQNMDSRDRAVEYSEAAKELLQEAEEELRRGNVRQAAEKVWGAAALVIKAYAY